MGLKCSKEALINSSRARRGILGFAPEIKIIPRPQDNRGDSNYIEFFNPIGRLIFQPFRVAIPPVMTAGTSRWDRPSRRHSLRCRVQAPVDVTVLRSGVPDTVPGRIVDLGAGGVSAVLARELNPGESVGVEIDLPGPAGRLRMRALVRHHDKLRCGMEFVGLSDQQKAALRALTKKGRERERDTVRPGPQASGSPLIPEMPGGKWTGKGSESGTAGSPVPEPGMRSRGWIFLLASIVILLAVLRWRWDRGWEELEAGLHLAEPAEQPETQVSAEVMQRLVTHRVDPEYPEAARSGHLQGIVIADVVIGRDGSVLSVHPISGPEVFTQPAAEALRWWRFEPYRQDGRPIVVATTVAVEFKP
jgi:protein TonB